MNSWYETDHPQEYLYKNQNGHAASVTSNLLSFTSQLPGTGVVYSLIDAQPTHKKHLHYDRVMVPQVLEDSLPHMLVGEQREYDRGKWLEPTYFTAPKPIREAQIVNAPSQIWSGFKMNTIGNPENAKAKVHADSRDQALSSHAATVETAMRANKFTNRENQSMVLNWNRGIDQNADPDIAAEAPQEPEVQTEGEIPATHRGVEEDSDSESDVPRRKPLGQSNLERQNRQGDIKSSDFFNAEAAQQSFAANAERIRAQRQNRSSKTPQLLDSSSDLKHVNCQVLQPNVVWADKVRETEREAAENNNEFEKLTPSAATNTRERIHRSGRPRFGYDGADEECDGNNEEVPHTHNINERRSQISDEFEFDPTLPGFNPRAYGADTRKENPSRGSNGTRSSGTTRVRESRKPARPHPSGSLIAPQSVTTTDPVPTMTHTPILSNRQSRTVPGNRLVDVDDDLVSEGLDASPKPPPGLVMRSSQRYRRESDHLQDDRAANASRTSPSVPLGDEPSRLSDNFSLSLSSSSVRTESTNMSYLPQTYITRPDVNQIGSDVLAQLLNTRERQMVSRPCTRERLADEEKRRYHHTMNLKAQNPGKKKSGGLQTIQNQKENKNNNKAQQFIQAQVEATRPKVHPLTTPAATRTETQPEPMTPRARQLAKSNPELAALHVDELGETALENLAVSFVTEMRPAIQAAQYLCGRLELEMQIGKLLVLEGGKADEKKVYESERWSRIFGSHRVNVKFTNILSSHGPDLDRILETKTKKLKTWNKEHPEPFLAHVHFDCHDNMGQTFRITLKEDGSYTVHGHTTIIHKTGVHCPGRIWDTCAILQGLPDWQEPFDKLEEDVAKFVSTVYVQEEERTVVHFRPLNSFVVTSILVQRSSLHDCRVPGEESLALKITEMKTLLIQTHKFDKTLHQAYEQDHDEMAIKNKIHYEVAIIDREMDETFSTCLNKTVGDASPAIVDVFTVQKARGMLGAALRLIDKIDWVGEENYGSLVRRDDEVVRRHEEIARTIGPPTVARSAIRPSQPVLYGTQTANTFAASTINGSGPLFPPGTPTQVRGIRANTQAQLYKDGDGNLFYLGSGGARVPVEPSAAGVPTEIYPKDSASQYGARKTRTNGAAYTEKPDRFW